MPRALSAPRHPWLAVALVVLFAVGVRWLGLHVVLPALGSIGGVLVLGFQFGVVLWLGVQAALAEETLFRGYLQGALAARFSAAVAVGIGLVLGLLRARGGLLAPAVAHSALWAIWGDA